MNDEDMAQAIKGACSVYKKAPQKRLPEIIFCNGNNYERIQKAVEEAGLKIKVVVVDWIK